MSPPGRGCRRTWQCRGPWISARCLLWQFAVRDRLPARDIARWRLAAMVSYLIRRLLWMIVVIFGVSIVVFSLIHITPGDPARIMLGPSGRPEDVAKLRHQLGLDQSVTVQYARWVSRAVRGDLGQSIVLRRPVLG